MLESYNTEAIVTADENILNSTRSTDFLTPKSKISAAFRDAVLDLASRYPFARALVNSGRLSTAVHYPASPLSTADEDDWTGGVAPGQLAPDAPLDGDWLLSKLGGSFKILSNGPVGEVPAGIEAIDLGRFADNALALKRFALGDGGVYLIRPDQYVAARFKDAVGGKIGAALAAAKGAAK